MNPELDAGLLLRVARWCLYRERSLAEVERWLQEVGLDESQAAACLTYLLAEGYINPDRFIQEYINGKFRLKSWGKQKIRQGLLRAGVPAADAERGLRQCIDDADYLECLKRLIAKRLKTSAQPASLVERRKLVAYLLGKGYEYAWIEVALAELPPDDGPQSPADP